MAIIWAGNAVDEYQLCICRDDGILAVARDEMADPELTPVGGDEHQGSPSQMNMLWLRLFPAPGKSQHMHSNRTCRDIEELAGGQVPLTVRGRISYR